MSNILSGNIEVLSTLQITADTAGMDAACKRILRHKEVLAVIMKDTIEEFYGYSLVEIMDFIEADSISSQEVSRGRTNTMIQGEATEFAELNEKLTTFDVLFKAKNPKLSNDNVLVNLHIDVEPQKTYRPGYPIEKRGIYYLARALSAQLGLITEQTDYSQLEKCYSIWICRDYVPKKERFTMSFYKMMNYKNTGNCKSKEKDYDLLHMVIIRLGAADYLGEGDDIFRFLTALFYPRKQDFRNTIEKYIDISANLELEKEVKNVRGLGQCILEEGFEKGELCLLIRMVCKKLEKGKVPEMIAEELEEDLPVINQICEAANSCDKGYDIDEIYKLLC